MNFFKKGDTEKERLEKFAGTQSLEQVPEEGEEKKSTKKTTSALTDSIDKTLEERGIGGGLADQLAKADLKWTVAEFWAANVIAIIVMMALMLIWQGLNFIWLGVGAIVGFGAPKVWLNMRVSGRIAAFNDQLGDAITLMANGLRAGYSMLQAMESVGTEMPDPIKTEFKRVVQEISLGVDSEKAFNNLLRRVPSGDLDLMIAAINVQAEVGGNLAEILEVIGEVIRERVRIKGHIAVLTAQASISGLVITALPIILSLLLFAMNEPYMGRLIYACKEGTSMLTVKCSQPIGWIFTATAVTSISVGYFVMSQFTKIDV